MAKITPVFKGDDDTDANNYRPISLLSNFNRVFEKIIYKRLTSYIEKHDLFNSSQYGFRKGHSTPRGGELPYGTDGDARRKF